VSRSITRRLLASNLLILAAFLGFAGTALDRAFRDSTEAATREQLQAHVYTLLSAAQEDERGRMRLPESLAAPAFNQPDSGLYAEVAGEDGNYHWRSGSLLGRELNLLKASRPGQTRFRLSPDLAIFDQGIAWEDDDGTPIGYSLSVAVDSATIRLFPTASCRASVVQRTLNHSVVKPVSGKAMIVDWLKAKIGSSTTGA
jgi:two-component system sensor histidine kinase PhoQ